MSRGGNHQNVSSKNMGNLSLKPTTHASGIYKPLTPICSQVIIVLLCPQPPLSTISWGLNSSLLPMMVCVLFLHWTTTLKLNNTFSVRKAYRKRALETHPDKLDPGASEAEKQDAEQQFHKVKLFFTFYVFKILLMILKPFETCILI